MSAKIKPRTVNLQIQRTHHLLLPAALHGMCVEHRCLNVGVAKQLLDRPQIDIRREQVAGKTNDERCVPLASWRSMEEITK